MSDTTAHDWHEVTRAAPCPACGKPDWCAVADGGALVRCMRPDIAATPNGYRHVRDNADGGRLFAIDSESPILPKRKTIAKSRPVIDWTVQAQRYADTITYQHVEALSCDLSITVESLYAVGIGWDIGRGVYIFPERNAERCIIGISTRDADGAKRFIKGGNRGLTIPDSFNAASVDPLLIVEGVTDVCACLTLGIMAIGRPSNVGGVELLADLLADYTGEVFIVGENDQKPDGRWPGRDGAKQTAARLASALGKSVKWTMTPHGAKDLRRWLADHDAHLTEELREVLL